LWQNDTMKPEQEHMSSSYESPPNEETTDTAANDDRKAVRKIGFMRDAETPDREIIVRRIGTFKELAQEQGESLSQFAGLRRILKNVDEISACARGELPEPEQTNTLAYAGYQNYQTAREQGGTPSKFLAENKAYEKYKNALEQGLIRAESKKGARLKPPHVLIAGGFVRDVLMEKKPKDIDMATNCAYEQLEAVFQGAFEEDIQSQRVTIGQTGADFPVLRIRFYTNEPAERRVAEEYEIATFRTETDYRDGRHPEVITPTLYAGRDANRRDLTINGLFYNPLSGNVIDYVGGLQDIQARRLRFIGSPEKRIEEDKLRMLRYVRFLTRTGFQADESAKQAIRTNAANIRALSAERVRSELEMTLASGKAGDVVETLAEYGLLKELLPDVAELETCEQGPPYHMEGTAYAHTITVANNLPDGASVELKWAAILHDIGKPEAKNVETSAEGTQKVSFLKHEDASARKTELILRKLKFSNKSAEKILWLVANHIRAHHFAEMRSGKAKKFAESPYCKELLQLADADIRGSVANDPALTEANRHMMAKAWQIYEKLQTLQKETGSALAELKKQLNGSMIMQEYEELYKKEKPPDGQQRGHIIKTIQEIIFYEEGIADIDTAKKRMKELLQERIFIPRGHP
jgi:poly(A) polymerase